MTKNHPAVQPPITNSIPATSIGPPLRREVKLTFNSLIVSQKMIDKFIDLAIRCSESNRLQGLRNSCGTENVMDDLKSLIMFKCTSHDNDYILPILDSISEPVILINSCRVHLS